jgi:hypothetical protein
LGIGALNLRSFGAQGPGGGLVGVTGAAPTGPVPGGATPPTAQPGTPTAQPAQPTGTGAAAATTRAGAADLNARYYTSISTLSFTHRPTKEIELGAFASYTAASGMTDEARIYYPNVRGKSLGVRAGDVYRLSTRDSLNGSVSVVDTWSSNGNFAATLLATETLFHRFDARTSGSIGTGLNVTRFAQADGLRGYSVFPTVQASFSHQLRVGRGDLSFTLFGYSAPALDPLRALVDPRVGAGANATYTRKHLLVSLTGNAAFSIAPATQEASAIDAVQGQGVVSYRFGDALTVDGGVRYLRQGYGGVAVVPSTWVGFVGMTLGFDVRVAGNHP